MTPLPPVSVKYARNNNTRVAERVITGLIKARACAFGDANVLSLVACGRGHKYIREPRLGVAFGSLTLSPRSAGATVR